MPGPSFALRTGQAGALVEGTPGDVLTIQPDGTVAPETPAAGGSLPWAHMRSTLDDNVFPVAAADTLVAITGTSFDLATSLAGFALGADGVLTYVGLDPITVLATAVANLVGSSLALSGYGALLVSLNSDMIGDGVLDDAPHSVEQSTNGVSVNATIAGDFGPDELRGSHCYTAPRRCSLVTGDTLRLIAAQKLADPINVLSCSLYVQTLSKP